MSRPSRRSGARIGALAAGLLAASLLPAGPAAASFAPLVMGPLYVEPAATADHPAPSSAGGCAVQIVELKDSRRAPETLGNLAGFKAIQAPADREAWLRSIFQVGLTARGFKVSFAGDGPTPGAVTARIRLQAVWMSAPAMNKAGDALLRMSAAAPGGSPGPEKIYRGDQTAVNWAGTTSEFNGMLDRMFANALDSMAADLRPLCTSGSATG